MGWKRALLGLLVLGTLAIGLSQIGLAKDENDNRNVSSDEYSEEVLASLSTWNVEFEEGFDEGWDSSLFTANLDASTWRLVTDYERTALRVACNCWVETPGSCVWGDYAVTTCLKVDHGGVTLSFRQCSDGRYFVGIEEGRFFLGKEQPRGHRTTLATAPFSMGLEEWHEVMIAGVGPELFVFLDGKLGIRYIDEASPILAGGITYETCGDSPVLLIDRIEVLSGDQEDPQVLLNRGYACLDEHASEPAYEAFAKARELFHEEEDKPGEAEALRGMGTALIALSDVPTAITQSQMALEILIEIGDRASEAWCYLDIGNAHMQLGDLPTAEECFESARSSFVALSDREGEIEALRSEGRFLLALASGFTRVGNPTQAISSIQSALRAFRDAEDKQDEANALMTLANLYVESRRFTDAVECCEQAEPLFRSVRDLHGVRGTLQVRLDCYSCIGQFDLAMGFGERALTAHRSDGTNPEGEAWTLSTLSRVYSEQGDLQRAIDYSLLAVSMYQELGNMVELPEVLWRLAGHYYQVGQMDIAAEYQQMSIDISLSSDGKDLAEGLRQLGHLQIDNGDIPAAVASFEQAASAFREFQSDSGEVACLVPLADLYLSMGNSQQAITYADEIMAIGERSQSTIFIHSGLGLLVRIYVYLGQIEKAIEYAKQQLENAQGTINGNEPLDLPGQVGIYHSLAGLHKDSGRLQEAIAFLEQGLLITQGSGALAMQLQLHQRLARYYQSFGSLEEAKTHYESAIEVIEHTFGGLEVDTLQESYFPQVRQLYVKYFMFLLAKGDLDETLWVAERSRARTYVEQVGRADVGLLDLLPESGIRSGVISAEQVEQDAREAIANLPVNTAAIEYFVMDEKTFVWVLRDGSINGPREIPISQADLQRRVVEYRTTIESAEGTLSSFPSEELQVMSRNLHDLLLTSINEWLEGIDHIVVVPSGPLYYLPFASLLDCPSCSGIDFLGGEYLVERYAISYSPSLSTLHFIQQREQEEGEGSHLLALADPASGDATMPRLPEARDEAEAIADLFGESEVLVDALATEDALQQGASDASHLLLSTHGLFDASNPMYSYLMLTPTETSDGRLHTYEVFELHLSADLVTLSACETLLPALDVARDAERLVRGLSDDVPITLSGEQLNELTSGDDVVGLTRAFLYAGSSSVLSTLWRVVSETTEQLMVAFYSYMEGGMNKAEALRQAQLDIMAVYPHPRYWAAFNLVGDWR